MGFSALFDELAESKTASNLPSLMPGIITAIEPSLTGEGLGRIRCKCDLLSEGTNVPNSFDGYVWVLEDFVVNGRPGGAHRPLQVGTQVLLGLLMGDPTQMVMLGCLHSREDRPDPIFDRGAGVHGRRSEGGTFTINNEKEGSRVDAYPTGVTVAATKDGGALTQTEGGARTHLTRDGQASIENPKASTVIAPDGKITAKSQGVTSILSPDGTAKILSEKFGSELSLNAIGSQLLGAASPLTGLLKDVQALAGPVGEAVELAKRLGGIGAQIGSGNDAIAFAKDATKFLEKVSNGLGASIGPLVEVLGKVERFELADVLRPNVEKVLGDDVIGLMKQIEEALAKGLSEVEKLIALSESDRDILARLSHAPKQQSEFILSLANPDGYKAIAGFSALGLADGLPKIDSWVQNVADLAIENTIADLAKAIPGEYQKFIPSVAEIPPDTAQILGSIVTGIVGQSKESIIGVKPIVEALPMVSELTKNFALGDLNAMTQNVAKIANIPALEQLGNIDLKNPGKAIEQVLGRLSAMLGPQLESALGDVAKIAHAIPEMGPRAKVEVESAVAKLSGALGKSTIFANDFGVGAHTPWGGFGFGSSGGVFSAGAKMAIEAVGKLSTSSLTLDPVQGITLAGKALGAEFPQIQFQQRGDEIHIGSPLSNASDGIRVTPDGVKIDGFEVSKLLDRIAVLENLVLSMSQEIKSIQSTKP